MNSSKLALYLKMIAHGEAEDVDTAVEHVKKEAQTEAGKKWDKKKGSCPSREGTAEGSQKASPARGSFQTYSGPQPASSTGPSDTAGGTSDGAISGSSYSCRSLKNQ